MLRLRPRFTRTYTPFPAPTLFRSERAIGAALAGHQDGSLGDLRRGAAADRQHRVAALELVGRDRLCDRRERRHGDAVEGPHRQARRSEEHTSELQSLMRISYAVFCLKKKTKKKPCNTPTK